MSLAVCPSCSRHARESVCPFCGAEIAHVVTPMAPRVPRIALIGAAVVVTACSQAMYGGSVPIDAGPQDSAKSDANDAMATFYGGPPLEAGIFDATADTGTDDAAPDAHDAGTD